jgi:hypothetical protein
MQGFKLSLRDPVAETLRATRSTRPFTLRRQVRESGATFFLLSKILEQLHELTYRGRPW